jgi:chromosome segregation ATPase
MSRWSRATAVGRYPRDRLQRLALAGMGHHALRDLLHDANPGSATSAGRLLARMGSSALGLENVTTQEDISQFAAQLAELTQTVEAMAKDLKAMTERADTQEERAYNQEARADTQEERADTQEARADNQEVRADTQEARADNWQTIAGGQDVLALKQQERIDLAARELAAVSHRLQAAATLLQESGVYSDPRKRFLE